MKILFLRHKYITILAGVLMAAGVFLAVTVPAAVSASATERQLPIYCVNRDQKVCSISFDAAWGDASAQSRLDILNKYNMVYLPLMFFLSLLCRNVDIFHSLGNYHCLALALYSYMMDNLDMLKTFQICLVLQPS